MAALAALLLAAMLWMAFGFEGSYLKRTAIDWMQTRHARTLVIDGPVRLQLLPRPALAVQGMHLSEPGRPGERFASVASASLSLRLWPLLRQRAIEVDLVEARGVRLVLRRDAEGRRNVDDLLRLAAGDRQPRASKPPAIERIELADVELEVADAAAGIDGRLAIEQLSLGRFGAGQRSPLQLKAQAELASPPLSAGLALDTEIELLASEDADAPPRLRLGRTSLHLQGRGFAFEALDARLTAHAIDLGQGAARSIVGGSATLDDLQLRLSGTRSDWRLEDGRLDLARLHLDVASRTLALDKLALRLQGHHRDTKFGARLDWPALEVVGERLQGGSIDGSLTLAGDQQLQLQLRSQAPSGNFDRITVPALHVDIDGRAGQRAVAGKADAALVLEPEPLAAALDDLVLALQLSDPSLPPLKLDLRGDAHLSARAGTGRAEGRINGQQFETRLDVALDRARPYVDVDARFGTLDLSHFGAPERRGAAPVPAPMDANMAVDLSLLRWADARLRLNVARLVQPPYRVDGLEVQARTDNGVLELSRLHGRAWGGRLSASGRAEVAGNRLSLRLNAADVDLRAMLSDTIGFQSLHGRGRVDADLSGSGDTVAAVRAALNGRVVLALEPAAIRGIDLARTLGGWRSAVRIGTTGVAADETRQTDFSRLGASFAVRNGVASSTDLAGLSPFLRVAGDGAIDLVRGSVDYRLRATVINTASGRAGPEMVLLNGVTVPVELSGPLGQVGWTIDWPAVTAGVAARSAPNAVRGAAGAATTVVGGTVRGIGRVLGGGERRPPP